jgi:hypothetical protein
VKSDRRSYDITYYDGVKKYIVHFPKKRGACKISKIYDQDGNDVTPIVLTYMGPSHNFHGIPTSPEMLGYESLDVLTINDHMHSFCDKEYIKI